MASKSKKKSTSKKTTGKTTKKAGENFVIDEIIIWIVLAVSILLLISNFGFGGTLGASASAFLMESFGAGAYLVPFLLFGVTAFLVSNKHNRIAYWKSGAAVICFLILCGLFELISDAGGTVGGSLADILSPALGVAGTYVILIIMMIIGIVIITRAFRSQRCKEAERSRLFTCKRVQYQKARGICKTQGRTTHSQRRKRTGTG